jgi:hypothetical protein
MERRFVEARLKVDRIADRDQSAGMDEAPDRDRPLLSGWRCCVCLALYWAVTISAWSAIAAGSFSPALFLAALLVTAPILGLGLLVASRLTPAFPLANDGLFVFLCGFLSCNLLLFILAFASPFGTLVNLLVVLAATSWVYFSQRELRATAERTAIADIHALLALLVASVAPVLWFQESVQFATAQPDGVVFHGWVDVFLHSALLNSFSGPSGLRHLHGVYAAGSPLPLYHYAGYIVPATLKAVSGIPALLLASTIMPCLGLFLVTLAGYCVGRIYGRGPGGVAAACAAALLPDPSFYGVASRWNSYYFFLQVSAALGYAIAMMGLALALIMGGLTSNLRRPVVMGLLATACVVWFKAPVAVAYAFGTAVLGLAFMPRASRRQRALLSTAALAGLVIVISILRRLPGVPTLGWTPAGPPATIVAMLGSALPTGLIGDVFAGPFQAAQSAVGRLSIGATIALCGYLGVFALLFPLGLRQAIRQHCPRPVIAYAVLVILNLLVVALLLAPNASGRGDAFEIIHKTFAWPYFATATWLGALLGGGLVARVERSAGGKWLTAILVALACAVPLAYGHRTVSGIGWLGLSNVRVPHGLYECAVFLRDRSESDSTVQMQPPLLDSWLILPALSERPAFVAVYGGPRRPQTEEQRRLDLLNAIFQNTDATAARRTLAGTGIDWLVTDTEQAPEWLQHLPADFASGTYRVYKVSTISD